MGERMNKAGAIWLDNIPNLLTMSRIILTFAVVYLIFTDTSLITIVIVFAIAALTDFFDGQLARKFNWTSEFGRKADMIADRFLWAGTAIAFIVSYGLAHRIGVIEGIQLLLIMSREIISAPFAVLSFFSGARIPHARFIAKVTTLLQGFALPALILSIDYPQWFNLSWPLAVAIGITGTMSAFYYIYDLQNPPDKPKRKTA